MFNWLSHRPLSLNVQIFLSTATQRVAEIWVRSQWSSTLFRSIYVLRAEIWSSSSSPNRPRKTVDWFRFFKNYNKKSFIRDLQQVPWHVVFDLSENIDGCVDVWNKLYFWKLLIHMRVLSLEKLKGLPDTMDELNYCSTHEKHDYHFQKPKENKFGHHWRLYCSLRNRVHSNITKYYAKN